MDKIADVIKYEGDNTTFIWKSPCEDFNSLTQLIVHESQEAIFFMNGQALDLFGAGRYTLETQNVPKLGRFLNRTTGGQTPFHCEVYFINLTEQMAIKWGTDSKVQYMDPAYGFPLSIGASGEMSLSVADSRKLLVHLVGTENGINRDKLVSYFRSFLMTKVKSYIAQSMKSLSISIFEIDEHLEDFSKDLRIKLMPDFLDYGLNLERFFVTTIQKPDGGAQYEQFKKLHFRQYADIMDAKLRQQVGIIDEQTKARQTVIASQAKAAKRAQEGYTYQQERGFDVAQDVAKNEAVGQFTNLGVGIGTAAGVGGAVGGVVGTAVHGAFSGIGGETPNSTVPDGNPQTGASAPTCPNCGMALPNGAKFCLNCGAKIEPRIPDGKTVCPGCGKTVIKGKFCPECGFQFTSVCPKCGADVTGMKFCPNCGEKLI